MPKRSRPHSEALIEDLKADPKFAAEYLSASLEELPNTFIVALRHIAEAYGLTEPQLQQRLAELEAHNFGLQSLLGAHQTRLKEVEQQLAAAREGIERALQLIDPMDEITKRPLREALALLKGE